MHNRRVSEGEHAGVTVVRGLARKDREVNFTVVGPCGEGRVRFWGDIPASPTPPAETALAAALLPAMSTGDRLFLPGPVSPQLRRALPDVQAVLASLAAASPFADRPLQTVEVTVHPDTKEMSDESRPNGTRGVGLFFSGGVDSWAALLANPEVTDLIYVHGFDIPVDQHGTSSVVEARLAETAKRLGKRLHVVRTDLRTLLDPRAPWEIGHGPALASVALLFTARCERVLIGAGMTYGHLANRGSHPLHDHLWSTERCRIEHHGAHLTRAEKIEQIAQCREALNMLRVCWRQVDRYNCGRCEKCLRAMVALEAIGALDRCPTFAAPLDLDAVAGLVVADTELRVWWHENLALARASAAPPELIAAVESCLERSAAHTPEGATEAIAQLGETEAEVAMLAAELQTIVTSRSWRLTRPFRRAGAAARRLRRRAAGG
jgi:hypothetical protein